MDYSSGINTLIQKNIENWGLKGKYEKLADFKERTSNEMLEKHKDSLLTNYLSTSISKRIHPLFNTPMRIESYDTESEIFKIASAYFGSLYFKIPIAEAEAFENHFKANEIAIKSMNIQVDHNGTKRIYPYDIYDAINFKGQDIALPTADNIRSFEEVLFNF